MRAFWETETPGKFPDIKQACVCVQLQSNLSANNEKQSIIKNISQVSLSCIIACWLWWLLNLKCPGSRALGGSWSQSGCHCSAPSFTAWHTCLLQIKTSLSLFTGQNRSVLALRWMEPPDHWSVPPAADEHYGLADGVPVICVLQVVADWILLS